MPGPGLFVAETPLVVVAGTGETGTLTPVELEDAGRFAHPKRRAEWLFGRLAAKAALVRALGREAGEIVVRAGEDGAPVALTVQGESIPVGLSITHGHGLGAAWALPGGLPG